MHRDELLLINLKKQFTYTYLFFSMKFDTNALSLSKVLKDLKKLYDHVCLPYKCQILHEMLKRFIFNFEGLNVVLHKE